MKIGDVIISKHGPFANYLACGSGVYTHAIVVSVEPFAMVSEEGDMLWVCAKKSEFVALCQASKEIQEVALARWNRETSLRSRQP